MSRTFVKYPRNHNNNYQRFYEVKANAELCNNCPSKSASGVYWNNVSINAKYQPVNTNWAENNTNEITTIVISESPSNEETSYGVPTVGKTGQVIYKHFINDHLEKGWLKELDSKVYRTNIVRCQADAGIKGDTIIKNKRVHEAWPFCKEHLMSELEKVFRTLKKDNQIVIYIAPGQSFHEQINETMRIIGTLREKYNHLEIEVKEGDHFSSREI